MGPINKPASQSTDGYADLFQIDRKIKAVDIGANPIDGDPPYKPLLKRGLCQVVGFEPLEQALSKLNARKGENELYLPHAVGDGARKKLYVTHARGMTSTFRPNETFLSFFQGYPDWARVVDTHEINTVRLDDIAELKDSDFIKIDIQGGELNALQNAVSLLKDVVLIHTEVNFVPLYQGQPLFADIDAFLRQSGFMFHTFVDMRKRLFAPIVVDNQIHWGINQVTTADAVYLKNFESLINASSEKLKILALMLHDIYKSIDLAQLILKLHDEIFGTSMQKSYISHICVNG